MGTVFFVKDGRMYIVGIYVGDGYVILLKQGRGKKYNYVRILRKNLLPSRRVIN